MAEDAYKKIEPDAVASDHKYDRSVLLSIAISLKRIADTLEGSDANLGIVDHLSQTLQCAAQRIGR